MLSFFLFFSASIKLNITDDTYASFSIMPNDIFDFSIIDPNTKAIFILDTTTPFNLINLNFTWNETVRYDGTVNAQAFSFDGKKGIIKSTSQFKFFLYGVSKSNCPDFFSVYQANEESVVKTTFAQNILSYCLFPIEPQFSDISVIFDAKHDSAAFVHYNGTDSEIKSTIKPPKPFYLYVTNVVAHQSVSFSVSGSKSGNPFNYVCSHYSGGRYSNGLFNGTDKSETPINCANASSNTIWRYTAIALVGCAFIVAIFFLTKWCIKKCKKRQEEKRDASYISTVSTKSPISVNLNEPLLNQNSNASYSDPQQEDEKAVVFFQRKPANV